MRILLAPDKFKGSLTAPQVCDALAAGLRRLDPNATIDQCPVADGGEGTVDALVAATGGRFEKTTVTGPRTDMLVDATFGMLESLDANREPSGRVPAQRKIPGTDASHPPLTAVIEMSAASGLALLQPQDRDPCKTTTFGTGQLLLRAAELGATHIILGIGGSATIDAGVGCCQACALPVILQDEGLADPHEPLIGEDLRRVVLIKHARGSPVDRVKITVASDVTNPLFGPNGSAHIFGPQKGATPQQVEEFDQLHRRLAERCGKLAEADAPGAGAAGGLGWAMLSFFNATLRPGFDIVADAVRLRQRLVGADLCITGEGRLDASSLGGKAAIGVARLCKQLDIPCIAIVGSTGVGAERAMREGISQIIPIKPASMPLTEAISNAARLIESAAAALDWRN